jgi:MoaA/NifB/PqqE/SkfB family radical SAM enzyme
MLTEETHAASVADDKITSHEDAAHEKRNWVRLTFECNNRCTFCLDSNTHNGEMRERDEVKGQILDGRQKGATRLILSGGEPTIHPQYVDFIRLGRMAGYRKIQTVTNGRLFGYEFFLKKCLDAGLSEITFSLHGPNPKIHDALVGVPGAFEQETKGLKNALADGRPIVNVDIVINKGNVKVLPQMLDLFISWGVREFDLLQVVPFGRAFTEGRESLFYDLEEMRPYLLAAFEYSKRADLHLWFNRFPPQHLEGFEHLIQDPYKLNDEVRGRKEEFAGLLQNGVDLDCRDPARCRYCYLERLCDTLYDVRRMVQAQAFERVRVDTEWEAHQGPVFGGDPASARRAQVKQHEQPWQAPDPASLAPHRVEGQPTTGYPLPQLPSKPAQPKLTPIELAKAARAKRLWIRAPDAAKAAPAVQGYETVTDLELELDEYSGLPAMLDAEGSVFAGKRLAACVARSSHQAQRLLAVPGAFEVVLLLTTESAQWLEALQQVSPRLVLRQPTHERLTESASQDVDLKAFFQRFKLPVPVEGLPACVIGREPRATPITLDTAMMESDGQLEIFRYTKRYIVDHYFTRSLRCKSCRYVSQCQGLHVNYVRAHGYSVMQPIEA